MTDTPHSKRRSPESNETAITKLAKQAHADIEVVRQLYDEEIAALHNQALVKGFVGIIAARRVRKRLLTARTQRPQHSARP